MAGTSSPNEVPLLPSSEVEESDLTAPNYVRRLISSVYARRGLLWLLLAIVSQATQVIMLTTVSKEMSAVQALFIRSIFLLTVIIGVSWEKSDSNNIIDMGLFILDAMSDTLFIYFIAMAGQYIYAGDVSAISLNLPIPSALFARIFLGEPLDALDAIFVVVNAIGLVIIAKPSWLFPDPRLTTSSSSNILLGVFLAFCSLAGNVSATMCVRGLVYRTAEDAWLLSFINGMVGIAVSLFFAFLTSPWKLPDTLNELKAVLILGACTPLTCLPYAKALETEDVKTVTVLATMAIPLTSCYDFFILKRPFDLAKLCGVLLILGSTFAMYLKTLRISRRTDDRI